MYMQKGGESCKNILYFIEKEINVNMYYSIKKTCTIQKWKIEINLIWIKLNEEI